MKAPTEDPSDYINQKIFHSVQFVKLICRLQLKIELKKLHKM